jgi:ribosome-associated protein
MNNKEIALMAAAVLLKKKALDVVIIDIAEKSSFADYFVIASGGSERQVGTLSDEIEDQFAKEGVLTKSVEGKKTSGWILMDFGDVIVNIFTTEQRDRYKIEKIWNDCTFLEIDEEELLK